MVKLLLAGAVALLPIAGLGAQTIDPVSYEAMAQGRYSAAEAKLAARVAKGSEDPAVLLNLAHLYKRDGRVADAEMLYRRVLGSTNILMEMPDGRPAASHDLAGRGLARLASFATR